MQCALMSYSQRMFAYESSVLVGHALPGTTLRVSIKFMNDRHCG